MAHRKRIQSRLSPLLGQDPVPNRVQSHRIETSVPFCISRFDLVLKFSLWVLLLSWGTIWAFKMPNKRFKWQNRILKIWRCFLGLQVLVPVALSNFAWFQLFALLSQHVAWSMTSFLQDIMGQVRALVQQVSTNYDIQITNKHPILPWIVYFLNRYAVHNDGQTSYQRRWATDHKSPLFEIGETVRYHLPTIRALPKLEPRFYNGIWLGRDTMTNESIIGISGKIIRVRTKKKRVYPEKYNKQLMDVVNAYPWTSPTPAQAIQLAMLPLANLKTASYAIVTQTAVGQQGVSTQTPAQQPPQLPSQAMGSQPVAPTQQSTAATSPMATSPPTVPRPALPMPLQPPPVKASTTKRTQEEATGEAESKQARTQQEPKAKQRAQEPKATRLRIDAITITTKKREKITTASNEGKMRRCC